MSEGETMAEQECKDTRAGISAARRKWCSISASNVLPSSYAGAGGDVRRGTRQRKPAANFFQEMARDDKDVMRMLLEDIPSEELAFALGEDGDDGDNTIYGGGEDTDDNNSVPDPEGEDPEYDGTDSDDDDSDGEDVV